MLSLYDVAEGKGGAALWGMSENRRIRDEDWRVQST